MERNNVDQFSAAVQRFPMSQTYSQPQSVAPRNLIHHQPEALYHSSDSWSAGGSHSQPEFCASVNRHQGVNQPINQPNSSVVNPFLNSQLESRLSLLSLTPSACPSPFTAGSPAHESISAGGSFGRNGFPYARRQLYLGEIQRIRAQSAAHSQNHWNYQDSDNSDGLSGYDYVRNLYSPRRSLNGAALDYQPEVFRNGHLLPFEIEDGRPLGWNSRNNARSLSTNRTQPDSFLPMPRPRHHQIYSFLKDLRGRILSVAKDQYGCRFLQHKFEEGRPEDIQMIFLEVKDHVCELMVHQFGNYLIQKLFEVCNQDQMNQLLLLVTGDELKFTAVCTDTYGSRAVQKLLEHLTTLEQRHRVISVLRRITIPLTKIMHGHHIIQFCLKYFSIEDNKHILNVVADNCFDIATDKSGCCVLQQCVEHALGEPRERLIAEITSNALILSEHPYGNYVVQYVVGLRIAHVTEEIMAQLSGKYVSLSMNKYGSNVVEKCLKESQDYQMIPIIKEIIESPHFLRVLQDPYGNYVAQSALGMSKGGVHHAMVSLILGNYANLHSHPHGKRVLALAKGFKSYV